MTPTRRALITFAKYLAWTGVAAVATTAVNKLAGAAVLPDWSVPLIASVLKSLATYAATEAKENEP